MLYDVASSAFYTTIVAGFFPIFFKQYWAQSLDSITSTYYLACASSIASLIVALTAPWIGASSDRSAPIRKYFLIGASIATIICCLTLAIISEGDYALAMTIFVCASIAAALATTVYDGLLTHITTSDRYHLVSITGYAWGYLGGGILFAINILMILYPEWFGFESSTTSVKASFVLVGIWWFVWMLPLLLSIAKPTRRLFHLSCEKDRPQHDSLLILQSFRALLETAKQIKKRKPIWIFLLAYWLYIDGVGTVIRMAVDYGMSLGFHATHLMGALLVVQFIGFPATLMFITVSKRLGAKNGIYLGIFIYCIITFGAYFMQNVQHFYILAVGIALAQGGLQALSRSYYAHLIPKHHSGQYFGFYNAFGKFAAIVGPILMGGVAMITQSHQLSILSILCLFLLSIIAMACVRGDDSKA